MADTLSCFNFYIDKYKEISFTVSTTSNPNGVLQYDDNGNSFFSRSSGIRTLKSCTTFPYGSELILFSDDEYTKFSSTWDDYDNQLDIRYDTPVYYKFGYDTLELDDDDLSGYKFAVDMTDKRFYKGYLNNRPISEYAVEYDGITIDGDDIYKFRNTGDNEFVLLYYSSDQSVSDESVFTYMGCDDIDFEALSVCDQSQFDDSYRLKNFTTYGTTQNRTVYSTKQSLAYMGKSDTINVTNSMTIQVFDMNNNEDLRFYADGERFRIVAVSKLFDKVIYYTNCEIVDGVSTESTLGSSNKKTYTINYEERVEVSLDSVEFGDEEFGDGYFGGRYIFADNEVSADGSSRN